MVTVFQDSKGPLLIKFMDRNTTIIVLAYAEKLMELRAAVQEKHSVKESIWWIFWTTTRRLTQLFLRGQLRMKTGPESRTTHRVVQTWSVATIICLEISKLPLRARNFPATMKLNHVFSLFFEVLAILFFWGYVVSKFKMGGICFAGSKLHWKINFKILWKIGPSWCV